MSTCVSQGCQCHVRKFGNPARLPWQHQMLGLELRTTSYELGLEMKRRSLVRSTIELIVFKALVRQAPSRFHRSWSRSTISEQIILVPKRVWSTLQQCMGWSMVTRCSFSCEGVEKTESEPECFVYRSKAEEVRIYCVRCRRRREP